jgi:hypothetical protein
MFDPRWSLFRGDSLTYYLTSFSGKSIVLGLHQFLKLEETST